VAVLTAALRREIARPGGVVSKGKGEGRERGNGGTYSRALDDINTCGVSGGNGRRFPFPGGRERGDNFGEGEPDRVGPPVSEEERGKIPIREGVSWAAGSFLAGLIHPGSAR
jgi:hypothetical protein